MKGPKTIHCWAGIIDGCEDGFNIILNSPDVGLSDIEFISSITRNWKSYIEKATDFIRTKLGAHPEILGLDKGKASVYLSTNNIPIDCPRFVFYDRREWTIIFAECSFPIGEPYGIGVNFDSEQPIAIEDYSEAEIIEEA